MAHPMLHAPEITFFCSLLPGHFCSLLLALWLFWTPFSRLPKTPYGGSVMGVLCTTEGNC